MVKPMADTRRELLEEQFSDAALLLLMDNYAEAEGSELWEAYLESGAGIPERLDRACQEQIQKHYKETEKSALLRRTVYRAAKIAAVFAVCIFLSIQLVMSVEALRVPFLNMCLDVRRHFSSLTFQAEETAPQSPSDDSINLPIYVPDGFRLSVKHHNYDDFDLIYEDSGLFLAYTDSQDHILTIQTIPAAGTITIDTEGAETSEFLLNGMDAIHIRQEEDGMLRTIWIDPERQRLYDVSCDGLSEEEFSQYVFELSGMFLFSGLYAE